VGKATQQSQKPFLNPTDYYFQIIHRPKMSSVEARLAALETHVARLQDEKEINDLMVR
jgi:hypothetical protein